MREQVAFGCLLLPPPCPSAAVKSSTANWKWREKKLHIFGKINLHHFILILIYCNRDYMLLDIVHLTDWCAINTIGNFLKNLHYFQTITTTLILYYGKLENISFKIDTPMALFCWGPSMCSLFMNVTLITLLWWCHQVYAAGSRRLTPEDDQLLTQKISSPRIKITFEEKANRNLRMHYSFIHCVWLMSGNNSSRIFWLEKHRINPQHQSCVVHPPWFTAQITIINTI